MQHTGRATRFQFASLSYNSSHVKASVAQHNGLTEPGQQQTMNQNILQIKSFMFRPFVYIRNTGQTLSSQL